MTPSNDAPWFFLDAIPAAGETAALDHDEARHALGARRRAVGDALVVFDGRGTVAAATIVDARGRRDVTVRIDDRTAHDPPAPALRLATALPKGDRLSTLVNMATQLGVTSIMALTCRRSVVKIGPNLRPRLERIALEACKQSRQPWRPTIEPSCTPGDLPAACGGSLLVAHPGGRPLRDVLDELGGEAGRKAGHETPHEAGRGRKNAVTFVIGPEGGLTDDEVAQLTSAGVVAIDLGPTVLRLETAGIATLAAARLALPPENFRGSSGGPPGKLPGEGFSSGG